MEVEDPRAGNRRGLPAAPLGPGAGNPIPGKARPYFVETSAALPINWNGGTGQINISGVIYDNAGADYLGDNQNPESWPSLLSPKHVYELPYTTPLDIITRNRCYHAGDGKWYTDVWMPMSDRGGYGIDGQPGDDPYFAAKVTTRELVNFPADLLAKHAIDPNDPNFKPETRPLPEWPAWRPMVADTKPPVLVVPTSIVNQENQKLSQRIRASKATTKYGLQGADAARFQLANGLTLQWKDDATIDFENPAHLSAAGNHDYQVSITGTDPAGNVAAPVAVTVTVTDVQEGVDSWHDDFERPDGEITTGTDIWTRMGSEPGLFTQGGNLRTNEKSVTYLGPKLNNPDLFRFYGTTARDGGHYTCLTMELDKGDGTTGGLTMFIVYDNTVRVGGDSTAGGWAVQATSPVNTGTVFEGRWNDETKTLSVYSNGTFRDSCTTPYPATGRCGIVTISGAEINPTWADVGAAVL